MVLSLIAIIVSTLFREAVCHLLHFLQRRRGMDPLPPKAAPFPSWELQVFLMQFQGLAESTSVQCPLQLRRYNSSRLLRRLHAVLACNY